MMYSKQEIESDKQVRSNQEIYSFTYDGVSFEIVKDIRYNRYTRVFADKKLISREKESEKKVELRVQGRTKIFFLSYWYQNKKSFWKGKICNGLGVSIDGVPLSNSIASKKIQVNSGKPIVFALTILLFLKFFLLLQKYYTVLQNRTLLPQIAERIGFSTFLYFFFAILALFYFFTYSKNFMRSLLGSALILVLLFTDFFVVWIQEDYLSPFILIAIYILFLLLSPLYYAINSFREDN